VVTIVITGLGNEYPYITIKPPMTVFQRQASDTYFPLHPAYRNGQGKTLLSCGTE